MKQHLHQLAIFGGAPLFSTPLVVGQPDLSESDPILERIQGVLASGWITNNGPLVKQFENQVCTLTGANHCVAVSSGTMALQIMAKACGLKGEVIMPALTFIATPHAMEWIGLKPVFADVSPETHTLDVESVRKCITPETSAILGVHLWGNPCDVDGLQEVADEYNVKLLFDACHAFGCRNQGRSIGTFGDAEAFSFHATKFVHSLEGGAILTQSAELADRMNLMRNFGITGLSTVESPGINGKLNEVAAAVGLTSLERMSERIQHNRMLQLAYRSQLATCRGLRLLDNTADDGGNGQYAVVLVDSADFGMSRDALLQILRAEGVFARSYFVPGCHRSTPYASSETHSPVPLTTTDSVLESVLQLPVGPTVSLRAASQITRYLHSINRHASAIQDRLNAGVPVASHPNDPASVSTPLPLAG
jgi:dTDP-4-amino-4,6-dideoxygalactose transaminase